MAGHICTVIHLFKNLNIRNMKVPKDTAEMLIELEIVVLKALREWNSKQAETLIESEEKGEKDADKSKDIQRDT